VEEVSLRHANLLALGRICTRSPRSNSS
jgi:hypothetical protein